MSLYFLVFPEEREEEEREEREEESESTFLASLIANSNIYIMMALSKS